MNFGDLVDAGLADIRTGPFGTQLKAASYVQSGRPVLNVRNVGLGNVRPEKFEFIGEDTARRLSAHLLQPDDLVFGRKGAVERHALIEEDYAGALQGSDCIRVRLSSQSPLLPRFASYVLCTREHQLWMQRYCSHGSTMASLNQDILRLIEFPDLDRSAQQRVVDVLEVFDRLIANSRRRIEILDETAQSLYREWFVHLRFPGHKSATFGASALGPIPDSWSVARLGENLDLIMGQSPASKHYNEDGNGLPFHQGVGSYGRRYPVQGRWTREWSREAAAGDTLVSVRAPVGRLNVADRRLALGRGIAAARPRDGLSAFWFEALRQVFLREDSFGGGTIFKEVTRSDLLAIECIVPAYGLRSAAEALLRPIAGLDKQLDEQARCVTDARDLLLPRLVTGQIEVESLGIDDVFGWAELAESSVLV